jgi:hypothetical protein
MFTPLFKNPIFQGIPAMPVKVYDGIMAKAVQMKNKLKEGTPLGDGVISKENGIDVMRFEEKKEETVACMWDGATLVVFFSRMWLSNMAPASWMLKVKVVDEDGCVTTRELPCWCVEQGFQGIKPLLCLHLEEGNAVEKAEAIFGAENPIETKKAGNTVANFDREMWDSNSKQMIEGCILASLENEDTYNRYFNPLYKMVERLTGSKAVQPVVEVVEATHGDTIYANHCFAPESIVKTQTVMASDPSLSLRDAVKIANASKGQDGRDGGRNELGEILSRIFNQFYGKTHTEFLDAMYQNGEPLAKRACYGRSFSDGH